MDQMKTTRSQYQRGVPEMKEKKSNKGQVTIDISNLFKVDPEQIKLDVDHVHYSNIAYIQINQRDVQIDFLQLPGIPEEGGTKAKTTRIYLSHTAAKRLAETINTTLKNAVEMGGLEKLELE